MKHGTWKAAFTIEIGGLEVDIMELSSRSRTEILLQIHKGITSGELFEEEAQEQVAS